MQVALCMGLLCAVRCTLYAVRCALCAVRCALCAVRCACSTSAPHMPSSLVTAGVRRKASTPLLKMGRPPSAAEVAGRWWGGGGAEVRRR